MVSQVVNAGHDEIVWQMPLTMVGYYVGRHYKNLGKHVARKENGDKVKKELEQIKEYLNGKAKTRV